MIPKVNGMQRIYLYNQALSLREQRRARATKRDPGAFWDEEDIYDGSFNSLIDLEESIAEGLLEIR